MTKDCLPADTIRAMFSDALSAMYREEVPLYSDLVRIVEDVNTKVLRENPQLGAMMARAGMLEKYDCEPHGAIRVGTADELAKLGRVFAVMGMHAVGYYDLSVAGVPVHSTAFRPIDPISFDVSPLRIFCSLLRLDLIEDEELHAQAAELLSTRQILSGRALELLALAEAEGGLSPAEAEEFVAQVLDTFRWRETARVTADTYARLLDAHRLIADVVAFRGPHINHLTPRTLDIDAAQAAMIAAGMKAKAVVEGPPRRKVDILLRQTSFTALSEPIRFLSDDGEPGDAGTHTARFGEIEQRGAALTPKGRALYDELLAEARGEQGGGAVYAARLEQAFARFPDDVDVMRREALAYFEYRLTDKGEKALSEGAALRADIEWCIENGHVEMRPMIYEDFLPVSAAGIFQSNLGGTEGGAYAGNSSQDGFEQALGCRVLDPFALYEIRERALQDDILRRIEAVNA